MTLEFEYKDISRFSQPVRNHAFLLRCKPFENNIQKILSYNALVSGCKTMIAQKDSFGNCVVFSCIDEWHDSFSVEANGKVEIIENQVDTFINPIFRYPSPLCIWNDEMYRFALESKGYTTAITVKNLCAAINQKMKYQSGTTSNSTDSLKAYKSGIGVCQDISHVFVALLRSIGIPARYVAGYVKGLTVSHAWTEAYYDGCWHGYDATENLSQLDGYIKIAHGRDTSDCPLNRGTFIGNVTENVAIEIKVIQSA